MQNTETYVAYYVTKGKFKILSESRIKEIGAGDQVGFPPQTEYEVMATADDSELVWVYIPPKAEWFSLIEFLYSLITYFINFSNCKEEQ